MRLLQGTWPHSEYLIQKGETGICYMCGEVDHVATIRYSTVHATVCAHAVVEMKYKSKYVRNLCCMFLLSSAIRLKVLTDTGNSFSLYARNFCFR